MGNIKAKIKEIVAYWEVNEDECGLGVDWSEAHERCWRCGYKSKLERCHIIPDSLGGTDSPSNLVLLCHRCHREAPNHTNPKYMWIWLRATHSPRYDSYWTIRGEEEFKRMFNRKPFTYINEDRINMDDLRELANDEFKKTIIHFGEGGLNPSTIACIFAEIELKLKSKRNNE